MTKVITVLTDEKWSLPMHSANRMNRVMPRYLMRSVHPISFMSFQLEEIMAERYEAGNFQLPTLMNAISFINECDGLTFSSIKFGTEIGGYDSVTFLQRSSDGYQVQVTISNNTIWLRVGEYWDQNKFDEMMEKRIYTPHTAGTCFMLEYRIDPTKIFPAIAEFLRKEKWRSLIKNARLYYGGSYEAVSKWYDKAFNKAMLPEHQTLHPNSNAWKEKCARWEAEWRERLAA